MRRNVLFIAAILLVAGSLPSAAQIRVDMNNMTCGNWLGYSPENREFVRYWHKADIPSCTAHVRFRG